MRPRASLGSKPFRAGLFVDFVGRNEPTRAAWGSAFRGGVAMRSVFAFLLHRTIAYFLKFWHVILHYAYAIVQCFVSAVQLFG